ncbi:helix-turn-helix transcriptional regulator [uncultured Actinomyces sp.]|jgi:transcriptional regulator with XRE-family HTH domain|uniref:helix-turn-helix domain-containing protein n=1 Tax=uncultured Actinomyces sp. TaxID=249061 RepID=UPI0028060C7E|nr:helix-turn-helix transcriptional regulator [uncultured Actinomyces sp.]
MTLAENLVLEIKAELGRRDQSRSDLAADLGLSRQGMSNKLNGHSELTITELEKVSKTFGIPARILVARAEQAEAGAVADPAAPADTAALAASALAVAVAHTLSADEAEGPTEAELEAHVEACDSCTCAEDALEHARQAAEEVA